MLNKLKQFLFTITFLLLGLGGFAQTYPVTIYSHLSYPVPIYLSNYANRTTMNSPLQVDLSLNDLTIMNRQVRLKFYLQGRMTLISKDYVVGAQPIYLQGGGLTQLTNVQLGPYFEFQNLQGINPSQYGQPIPEGSYDFCVEVYDFATNKKLSKKTCVTTVIFQNDPPILNLPVNNEKIMKQDIQNIVFSWTPKNINVSNVEYEFSLVELWNPNIPYQTAFDYAPPLYTESTRMTTLQYDMMKPQLIPGKSYAWRVKAKALKGAEEIGMFKNNGFSEIFTFKYVSACNTPMGITVEGVSQDQAKIKWTGTATNSFDYQVNYREKNARSKWYTITTPRENATITNLKPNTTYEYTVGTACDKDEYTLSSINEFTTLAHDEIAFAGCGIKPDPADLLNKTPLPALYPNDVVTAGDFPIVVQHVSGGNGTFSGDGFVTLPFIDKFRKAIGGTFDANSDQNVGIKITFNNIGVNTDFKLISGEIVASYDANWGSMADGGKLIEEIGKIIDSVGDLFTKLDKLEEQKKAGTISETDYKKEWEETWNAIQKANDQYKGLIKISDLPDDLKEKVAALTPPFPDLATNDNTAVKGNSKSQTEEYRSKIDETIKEVKDYDKLRKGINLIKAPYVIAKSKHRKGMNDDNTGVNNDMQSGDMSDKQMLQLNPMFSDEIASSEDKLISAYSNLVKTYSMGDLEDVNMRMVNKFIESKGTDEFEDKDLTYFAEKHESTQRFISSIKNNIAFALKSNPYFIKEKKEISFKYKNDFEKTIKNDNRTDIPSPSLGSNFIDKVGGLGIAINDTWGYNVIVNKFALDETKKRFFVELEIEIFDHYGLDTLDIDPTEKPKYAKDSGFRSWFYLQHSKKYQLRPFITSIKFKKQIYEKY